MRRLGGMRVIGKHTRGSPRRRRDRERGGRACTLWDISQKKMSTQKASMLWEAHSGITHSLRVGVAW